MKYGSWNRSWFMGWPWHIFQGRFQWEQSKLMNRKDQIVFVESPHPELIYTVASSLRWRHNGRDSVSNHQPHGCLLNRLFRCRSKKTSPLRVTGLCVGNTPGNGEFPAQMASNAENISIWWRHHETYPVASFTKEVNSRLAKRPLVFNGRLANRGLTSLVKEATGIDTPFVACFQPVDFERYIEVIPIIWKLSGFERSCLT